MLRKLFLGFAGVALAAAMGGMTAQPATARCQDMVDCETRCACERTCAGLQPGSPEWLACTSRCKPSYVDCRCPLD